MRTYISSADFKFDSQSSISTHVSRCVCSVVHMCSDVCVQLYICVQICVSSCTYVLRCVCPVVHMCSDACMYVNECIQMYYVRMDDTVHAPLTLKCSMYSQSLLNTWVNT